MVNAVTFRPRMNQSVIHLDWITLYPLTVRESPRSTAGMPHASGLRSRKGTLAEMLASVGVGFGYLYPLPA